MISELALMLLPFGGTALMLRVIVKMGDDYGRKQGKG